MKNARFGGHPSRADRVQGLVRHGGVRFRRANRAAISDRRGIAADLRQTRRVGRDDWAAQAMAATAGSPNRSSATERRSKTLFERREISSVTKPSMCTLEGGGRESIAEKYMPEKYMPDAPANPDIQSQCVKFQRWKTASRPSCARRGRQAKRRKAGDFPSSRRIANGLDANA
jgi:hypothetical protein